VEPSIGLVVALAAEAEPIVRHYHLEPIGGAFPCYRDDALSLVVSGVGKASAAAATAYLHAKTGERSRGVWLNVGIAGHRTLDRGTLLLAHTVTDAATGKCWYPVRLGGPSIAAVEVRTVDCPETTFDRDLDAVYEMEASGFFATALRFSTLELVQTMKVVSDNLETGLEGLTARSISDSIASRLDLLDAMVEHYRVLATQLEPERGERLDALVNDYRKRWRFTTSETRRLRRLLSRWETLEPGEDHHPPALERVERGSEVLRSLETRVRSIASERPL
jgi:hypothetical protein